MRLLTAQDGKQLDQEAQKKYHLPVSILMENAGIALAHYALIQNPSSVVVLCGPGNNGGDGLVAARQLFVEGISRTEIILLCSPAKLKGAPKENYKRCKALGMKIYQASTPQSFSKYRSKIKKAELVIDAILGTGISREVKGVAATAIKLLNSTKNYIISADTQTTELFMERAFMPT